MSSFSSSFLLLNKRDWFKNFTYLTIIFLVLKSIIYLELAEVIKTLLFLNEA